MNDKTEHILIIDDEPDIRELLEITLTRMGKLTHSAQNVQGGKQLLGVTKPLGQDLLPGLDFIPGLQ